MAKIPGPQDFARVGPPSPQIVEPDTSGESFAADMGDTILQLGAQLKQRREQAEDAGFFADLSARASEEYTRLFEENKNKAVDDPDGLATFLRSEFRKKQSQLIEQSREMGFSPTQAGIQRANNHLTDLNGRFLTKAVTLENNARVERAEGQIGEATKKFSLSAFNDPESLDSSLEDAETAILAFSDVPGVSESAVRDSITNAKSNITRNAVEGLINKTPALALSRLDEGVYDANLDAETKNKLIDSARSAVKRGSTVSKARSTALIKDEIAGIRDTGERINVISDGEIFAQFPDRAPEILQQFAREEQGYRDRQAISLNTPEEDAELLGTRQPQGVGYASEVEYKQELIGTLQKKYQALGITGDGKSADPVGYISQVAPELVEGYQSDDPKVIRNTAFAVMNEQRRLGVPESRVRPLSKSQAQGILTQIESASQEDRASVIAGLQETYEGEDSTVYRHVFNQLVDEGMSPEVMVLAANANNPILAQKLSSLIDMSESDLKAGIDRAMINDIASGVNDATADFFATVSAGDFTGGSAQIIAQWNGVIEKLAILNFRQTGDTAKSVEQAVKQVITDNYHTMISGDPGVGRGVMAYMPKEIDGVVTSPEGVQRAIESAQTRQAIETFNPAPIGAPGDADFLAFDRTISTAMNSGFWVTNETGDGVILMLPLRSGAYLPLENERGERYEVKFSDASIRANLPVGDTMEAVERGRMRSL